MRKRLAAVLAAVALFSAGCGSTVTTGGPRAGGANTHPAATQGGGDAFGCNGTNQYSWCSNAPQAAPTAPQPTNTDCGGYSWCTPSQAANPPVPIPRVDNAPERFPTVPGPDAPLPSLPYHCATRADPQDTGLHIDPLDDEIVATALSSCLTKRPIKFRLNLTIWRKGPGGIWAPVPGGSGFSTVPPYVYPAFTTTHAGTKCIEGAYFLQIEIPEGSIAGDGGIIQAEDENGEEFDTGGLCQTH